MFPASCSKCFSISLYLCSFHVPFTSFHVHFMCLWFYVLSLKKQKRFRQTYLCFTVLLMTLWFLFFRSSPFSFWSSFHVPFILLSCHFSFLPFVLQVIPFFLYVLSFLSWFLPVSFEYSICESILSARNAFSFNQKNVFFELKYSIWYKFTIVCGQCELETNF